MKSNDRRARAPRLPLALAGCLLVLGSCNQEGEPEPFMDLGRLADSLSSYDSALVILKDTEGNILDTAFHGKVESRETLSSLPVPHYEGGMVTIAILGYRDGQVVYHTERTYDGQKRRTESLVPHVVPETALRLAAADTLIEVGETLPLPEVTITPENLHDKTLAWSTSDSRCVGIGPGHYRGMAPGTARLVVRLVSDTSKHADFEVRVRLRPRIDIERVDVGPDTLRLYTGGESGRLRGMAYPDSFAALSWTSRNPGVAMVDDSGKASPGAPGGTYIVAASRDDSTRRDSAWVQVKRDAPELIVGRDTAIGAGQSLEFAPRVAQEYGQVVQFKWDLDGDTVWDDSAAELRNLSRKYPEAGSFPTRFYVRDSEGNATTTGKKVAVMLGPVVLILSPSDNAQTNKTPIGVVWSVDGILQTAFTQEALVEGSNTVTRTARDTLGLSNTVSITVHLDKRPPERPTVQGPTITNARTPTWTWKGGGGGDGTFRYRLGSDVLEGAPEVRDTLFRTLVELEEGLHTLLVQERDAAGNWSASGSHAIRIDLAAPAAPVVAVAQASPTRNRRPTWSWTGDAAGGIGAYRYRLDSSDLGRGASETTARTFIPGEDLPDGLHTLFVQERDSAGNWSSAGQARIRVDATPPSPPVFTVQPAPLSNNSAPAWEWISGGGSDIGQFRIRFTGDTGWRAGAPAKTFAPGSSADGVYRLLVAERDSAGNWSDSSVSTARIDATPPAAPAFTAPNLSPLNSLRPAWTWSGGGGGMGTYRCKLDDANLASGATLIQSAAFTPSANLSEAPHTLHIQERDSAGNWSPVASRSVTLAVRGTLGGGPVSTGDASYPSLAMGASGVPYVAYREQEPGQVWVKRWNAAGNAWTAVAGEGFPVRYSPYISLALNGSELPFVAFGTSDDGVNRTEAMVIRPKASGTGWEAAGGEALSAGETYFTSLAITSAGIPYVSFQPYHTGLVRVWRPKAAGTGWESAAPSYDTWVVYSTMALNGSDVPYLAVEHPDHTLTVMRPNTAGSGWEIVGNSKFASNTPGFLSLAIHPSGIPYVAVGTAVWRLNTAANIWEKVGGAAFTSGTAGRACLAFDPAGTPHVAFVDGANGSRITVMRLNPAGTAWQPVGPAGLSAGAASNPTLVVSPTGVPFVSYLDGANGNRVTVAKVSFDP